MSAGRLLALADDLLNLLANSLEGDAQALECLRCHALALVDEAEQDVLSADVVVVEHSCFFLRKDYHPTRPISEPLEHSVLLFRCSIGFAPAAATMVTALGLFTTPTAGWSRCFPTAVRQPRTRMPGETLGKRPRDTMIACPKGSL